MVLGPATDVFGAEGELLGGDVSQDLLGEGGDEAFDRPVDLRARRTRGRLAGAVSVGMESVSQEGAGEGSDGEVALAPYRTGAGGGKRADDRAPKGDDRSAVLGGGPSQVSRRWVRSSNRVFPVLRSGVAEQVTLPVGVAQARVVVGGDGPG
jgi:hypothetical protein